MGIDHLDEEEEFLNDDDDENYDTLSLCDLPIKQGEENDVVSRPSSPHTFPDENNSVNDHDFEFSNIFVSETFDHGTILFCGKPIPISSEVITRTKTTSFSSSSFRKSTSGRSRSYRKHYIFIGLEKFPPKMEIADMRRRQSLRLRKPVPVISAEENPPPVVAGGGSSGALVKPGRFRSNLFSALTRMSFGCIGRHVV